MRVKQNTSSKNLSQSLLAFVSAKFSAWCLVNGQRVLKQSARGIREWLRDGCSHKLLTGEGDESCWRLSVSFIWLFVFKGPGPIQALTPWHLCSFNPGFVHPRDFMFSQQRHNKNLTWLSCEQPHQEVTNVRSGRIQCGALLWVQDAACGSTRLALFRFAETQPG